MPIFPLCSSSQRKSLTPLFFLLLTFFSISYFDYLNLGKLLESSNQATSGSIVALAAAGLVELLENLLSKDLAQLNAPLVEAVNVPDGTLDESQLLVVDNQSTQLSRADDISHQDGCRWSVAKEALVRDKLLGGALSSELVVSLADHESLGLGKVVGCQHLLVQVVVDGVVGLGGQDKVGGDQLGALVDKLEEGVLSVGARLAKQDSAW